MQFIKNGLLITVLINFGLSLQLHAAQAVNQSAERAQGRLKRLGGHLEQSKQQSAIAPEDVAATHMLLEEPGYCQLVKEKWFAQLMEHKEIIKKALENEFLYEATHFVFYHAQQQDNRVIGGLLKNMYEFIHKEPLGSDFEFLRFWPEGSDYPNVQSYLDSFSTFNVFNDHQAQVRSVLLAVNPSLFGNFNVLDECSWSYFLVNTSIGDFIKTSLEKIFKRCGFDKKFIKDLLDVNKKFQSKTGDLIQICIPKDLVNGCAYLSQPWGIPQKEYIFSIDRRPLAERDYDRLRQRYTKSSTILDLLQTQKGIIKDPENIQLRLFFSKTGPLLNPDMGAKVFRFTTLTSHQVEEYDRQIRMISAKMFVQHSPLLPPIKKQPDASMSFMRSLPVHEHDIAAQVVNRLVQPESVLQVLRMPNASEEVQKLLDRGAYINVKDKDGETPLMIAVRFRNVGLVKFLVNAGADIAIKDRYGRTAYHIARENQQHSSHAAYGEIAAYLKAEHKKRISTKKVRAHRLWVK
ncbi:MAG TPA: ankyrin repeat domain-containing protein [Candidatus Babeliales bacterium]|nr:ankyrin repeat domain-containing protein [Candidatus Babeliales bacterium]